MKCPKCGVESSAGAKFCENCGSSLVNPSASSEAPGGHQTEPPNMAPGQPEGSIGNAAVEKRKDQKQKPAKKGRGCCGWGCLVMLILLAVVVVSVGGAAMFFRVPQQLGLVTSAADRLLSGTPDWEGTKALKDELTKAGIDTQGMDIYVIPMAGKGGSLAVATLDASKGFHFESAAGRDPIIDYMAKLSSGDAAKQAGIERVAIDYRDLTGQSLVTLTAPTDAISRFAQGTVSREQFMQKLEGKANWPAFFQEVVK